ncbi:MAG: AI-2E family transporter [Anaerostipes hadrus]
MKRWEIYLDIIMELLVILAGALLLIFVLPKAIVFLWPFVAGWIISMMAHPVIEYLEKKVKLPKKFGSAILIAAVITGIIVVLYFAVRGIVLQVIGFIQDAPDIRHEIMRQGMIFQKIEQFLSILPPSFGKQFDQWSGSIGELFKKAASSAGDYGVAHAGGVAKGVTSGLLGLVVMLFAAYMFSLEREKLIAWYEKCIPGFVKHKINVFMKNSVGVLVSYCLAQLKIMIVIIAILWIGFFIAGIGHSFIYSVLVGIVDIFPILGTGTVIIPWAIFKLITGDIKTAVILLIIYAICLVLKQVLQPKMMGDSMGISALTTIFLIYVGLKFGGLGGMLLALILGMFVINLYQLGVFDRKIAFFKRRFEMLTINSEEEEKENKKE